MSSCYFQIKGFKISVVKLQYTRSVYSILSSEDAEHRLIEGWQYKLSIKICNKSASLLLNLTD